MTNLFISKNKARRKWRRKALLIDPHKSRLVLVEIKSRQPANRVPLWMIQKLIQPTFPMQEEIPITPAEYAFSDRLRQEMLEREPEDPRSEDQSSYSD